MPKNEPVKLVYPTNNTQTSTIVTMNNNRVTFSNAPVQNGTITLSPMTANQMTQPGQQQQTVMQGANIKITGQPQGQQAPTLIFKNAVNSSASGTFVTTSPVTMSKANNQVRSETTTSDDDDDDDRKKVMAMTEISFGSFFFDVCARLAPNFVFRFTFVLSHFTRCSSIKKNFLLKLFFF